jgi:hypothetical protein
MGFSWLLNSMLQRNRLHDRLRLALQDLFRSFLLLVTKHDHDPKEETPIVPGVTFSLIAKAVKQKHGTNKNGEGNTTGGLGLVTTIVSPTTALTSNLWVTTICIPPHHELKVDKSKGLEFFHVVQGKGKWGEQEPKRNAHDINKNKKSAAADGTIINAGDAFLIEANR